MSPVFAHGRLRLYLLKLLDEAPRHGYEVIRLLEERFEGLYAPSAGTVYPRLAKLEAEGLVTHTTEGGRKVYAITDAGRAELADRRGELADLELEIRESVAGLAAEIREGVQGVAGELRREMRAAAQEARAEGDCDAGLGSGFPNASDFLDGSWTDGDGWRQAKEEFRRARKEWKEQARRAKDESRRAREEAQRARRQAKDAQEQVRAQAQEELQRMAKLVQEQVQVHFSRGDWPTGVHEGLAELAKEFGDLGKHFGKEFGKDFGFGTSEATSRGKGSGGKSPGEDAPSEDADVPSGTEAAGGTRTAGKRPSEEATAGEAPAEEPTFYEKRPEEGKDFRKSPEPNVSGAETAGPGPVFTAKRDEVPVEYVPDWADEDSTGAPGRDLDRLLDRFRDDIRDAARDHGVSEEQLREARRHLAEAAAHIAVVLHAPKRPKGSTP
ncbi:PadR family transcriptional regulator [Streptomyces sp. p1417]|uniref:PadR family transcriptional regulator n=1 Tax=Streptomyces typhae TaxID=2681492 RepID=A0A6L6WS69_9ACTN|nr:PadR family transcriptional regulator [Streptomyces typhae]MVO83186.1 PadR family transcriptional regulator [Streptomyces typhae]